MRNQLLFCLLLTTVSIIPTGAQPTINGNYIASEPQVWNFMKYGEESAFVNVKNDSFCDY